MWEWLLKQLSANNRPAPQAAQTGAVDTLQLGQHIALIDSLRQLTNSPRSEVKYGPHSGDEGYQGVNISYRDGRNVIYVNPDSGAATSPPALTDRYAERDGASVGYILGHEFGHNVWANRPNNNEPFSRIQRSWSPDKSEEFAKAYADAFNLARATAKGGTYGPEVLTALDGMSYNTKAVFRYLMANPLFANHPLRGWGKQ